MAARSVLLLLAPLLGLGFAGCLGAADGAAPAADADPASDDVPSAPAPLVTATTGALSGLVQDEAATPIRGAFVHVGAPGPERAARTDGEGRFTVNGLPPGRWTVQASSIGYATVGATAEVAAGSVASVAITLPGFSVPDPYTVRFEERGFMAYGVAALDGEFAWAPDLGDENHKTTHELPLATEGLETILVEVYWTDHTTGLEIDLWKNVTCTPCAAEYEYANAKGFESITVRLDRPVDGWPGITQDRETLWLFVWPTSDDEHPVGASYQVPYDVYAEAFYHEPAPPGYSARGDH